MKHWHVRRFSGNVGNPDNGFAFRRTGLSPVRIGRHVELHFRLFHIGLARRNLRNPFRLSAGKVDNVYPEGNVMGHRHPDHRIAVLQLVLRRGYLDPFPGRLTYGNRPRLAAAGYRHRSVTGTERRVGFRFQGERTASGPPFGIRNRSRPSVGSLNVHPLGKRTGRYRPIANRQPKGIRFSVFIIGTLQGQRTKQNRLQPQDHSFHRSLSFRRIRSGIP